MGLSLIKAILQLLLEIRRSVTFRYIDSGLTFGQIAAKPFLNQTYNQHRRTIRKQLTYARKYKLRKRWPITYTYSTKIVY